MPPVFLSAKREIFDGTLHLCPAHPGNVPVRILFEQSLLAMKRVRPDALTKFAESVALLEKKHPLGGPAQRHPCDWSLIL